MGSDSPELTQRGLDSHRPVPYPLDHVASMNWAGRLGMRGTNFNRHPKIQSVPRPFRAAWPKEKPNPGPAGNAKSTGKPTGPARTEWGTSSSVHS